MTGKATSRKAVQTGRKRKQVIRYGIYVSDEKVYKDANRLACCSIAEIRLVSLNVTTPLAGCRATTAVSDKAAVQTCWHSETGYSVLVAIVDR
jgi:hypothetical protein